MRAQRLTMALLVVLLAGGCAGGPRLVQPSPAREWRGTLREARAAADSGRWASADHRLSQYALRYPDTDEAHEALYWRSLFRVSPANDTATRAAAITMLERYLARPGGDHRTEAQILLAASRDRLALQREADEKERELSQVRAALGRAQERQGTPPAAPEQPATDRGLAQEVERLKAELARANQELERIRRRLAGQQP